MFVDPGHIEFSTNLRSTSITRWRVLCLSNTGQIMLPLEIPSGSIILPIINPAKPKTDIDAAAKTGADRHAGRWTEEQRKANKFTNYTYNKTRRSKCIKRATRLSS